MSRCFGNVQDVFFRSGGSTIGVPEACGEKNACLSKVAALPRCKTCVCAACAQEGLAAEVWMLTMLVTVVIAVIVGESVIERWHVWWISH